MSLTLGCSTDHVCYGIRWRAAVAQAADVGEQTWAVDFPLQTNIQPHVTMRVVTDLG